PGGFVEEGWPTRRLNRLGRPPLFNKPVKDSKGSAFGGGPGGRAPWPFFLYFSRPDAAHVPLVTLQNAVTAAWLKLAMVARCACGTKYWPTGMKGGSSKARSCICSVIFLRSA